MQTDNSRGTFADVVRPRPASITTIARYVRRLIGEVHTDVAEIPRPAEQHVAYAIDLHQPNAVFGYICPLKDYVRLGFYYGGALPDPDELLVGEGKRLRHIKIYSIAEARRPAVRRLIKAAVAERKQALANS